MLANRFPNLTGKMVEQRPLLKSVREGSRAEAERLLREEEDREREVDRRYWAPLREELAAWRRGRG